MSSAPRAKFCQRRRRVGASAAQAAPAQSRVRAADAAPRATFARLEDVIAQAAAERDIQLKIMLERDVRLVRFEQGQVEFSLAPGGSTHLPQVLMRRLQEWTGERWIVALSSREGYPSIGERRAEAGARTPARRRRRSAGARGAGAFSRRGNRFGAQSRTSDRSDRCAASGPDSAEDVIYVDEDDADDD